MPDLTPEHFWRCTAPDTHAERVTSSDGTTVYRVMVDHCTCLGFKHRHKCKHVKDLVESGRVCTWLEVAGPEPVRVRKAGRRGTVYSCPRCGGPVESYTDYV